MEKVFSYRIVKIGGKAVSVALTALGLMAGAAQAGEVYLGSALGQVAADDGGTRTGARWHAWDYWDNIYNPSAGYAVSTSRSGDIFYGTTVTYSNTEGVAYNVYPWGSNPVTGWIDYLNDSYPWVAIDAQRSATFSLNTFGNIADTNVNNYHFGAGVTVGDSSRGSKAYASGEYWTDGGDASGGNAHWSIAVNAGVAAGAATAYAIDINGEAAFYGNAEINGDSRAQSFTVYGNNSMFNGSVNTVAAVAVNGNDNVFNGPVTAEQVNLSGNNTSFAGNVTVANGLNFLNGVTASMTNGSDVIGAVNMGANDATLRLSDTSQILGNVTAGGVNGTLIFEGSGAVTGTIGATGALASLKEIRLNGADTVDLNNSSQAAVVNYVNYQAAATLTARGGLALNQGATQNQVAFGQHDGTLQLAGSLTGVEGSDVVTTTGNNIGTVTMVGGTQSIIGNIGSNGQAIKTLNIGGTASSGFDTDAVSTTTVIGDVFAQNTVLQNTVSDSSELRMAGGYNLTGAVTTADATRGVLSMLGGTQTVAGNIGATGALAAVNAGATAGNTNLNGNVFAGQLNVTGTGTVNLNGNFTGAAIRYTTAGAGGADGTVNLADGKTVTGAISNATGTAGNGVFTFVKNGVVAAGYDIGSSALTSLKLVNVGDVAGTDAGAVTTDAIWATTTAVNNNSTLSVRGNKNINGAVTTEAHNTGTLTLVGGNQTITGAVGAAGASLATVNAGATGAFTTLNGMVYANTVKYNGGNGTVVLNGTNGGSAVGGLVGTVDFGAGGQGWLGIGDGVNLTTGANGIQFANANDAKMMFNGSSTVTGVLGAAATGSTLANSTLKSIYAGVANKTVTFKNDVHVSSTTFHVSGTGTVNLEGDLYGPLVYDDDGVVNVSNGKSILNDGTAALGLVTTTAGAGTGTLNYLGSTTLSNDLGTSGAALKAVNFHSDGAVPAVTQTINKNIYALTTTIGNATTGTTANITTNAYLGNSLTLAAANVTLNTANQDVAQVAAGTRIAGANPNTLTFAYTPEDDGRLSTTATVTNSTVGSGVITTNGATLNFSVAAQEWAANAGGVIDDNAASSITGATGSSLVMNGSEKVNIALLGSLKNGEFHTLIGVDAGTGAQKGTPTDNSYVIDSVLSRSNTGSLVVTFNRDENSYVTKSATTGHFSNAAAVQLGALGKAGATYSADMQTVFNKLDIDQWGFGNTQANLATQVKRLAPIANASGAQAALASTTSVLNSVGERLAVLRGDVAMAGLDGNGREMGTENTGWVKVLGSNSKAEAIGDYDGYKVTSSGLLAGADAKVGNGVVGGSFSYVSSNISQQDFRLGDSGKMNSGTLAVYGTQEYGDVFVDGALAFSQHSLSSSRATAIARTAQSDVDMNQTTLKLSAGYRIGIDDSKVNVLTPMVSVEAASLKQKAYTETGADALSLNVDSKNMSRTRASLGLRFNTVIEGASTTFYPELMVAFNRNQGMRNTDVVANYVGDTTATPFTTTAAVLPKSSYTVGAGLRFATSKTSEVQIGYRYEGGNGLSGSSAQVRGAWSF